MTAPLDPAAQDAAVRALLAQQAASVTGDPSAAGVYGDPAGAAQASGQGFNLAAAQATAVDVEALLAQLQELQARAQAAVDAASPPPEPPDLTLRVDSCAPSYLHDFAAKVESRLSAVEGKLAV